MTSRSEIIAAIACRMLQPVIENLQGSFEISVKIAFDLYIKIIVKLSGISGSLRITIQYKIIQTSSSPM